MQLHTPRILWVSDPHFSADHHDFPPTNEQSKFSLSESLRKDLEQQQIANIGAILISGDLTWRATRPEFDWARRFIEDIMSWAKLTPAHVLVCPGNHDLAFSKEPWTKGTPATDLSANSSAEYTHFYETLYEVKPNNFLSCGRRFCVPDGMIVDVVSLNSSVLQQVPDAFQGQGYLGAPQLDEVNRTMKWSRDPKRPKAFRVCMLHHHVVPIIHREHPELGTSASVVHDAGALTRWLTEYEVNLVLRGHMHLPSFIKEKRALDYPKQAEWHEIAVAALGSSGVDATHRPNQPNNYGIVEFARNQVVVSVRRISADDAIANDQRLVYSSTLKYEEP